MKNLLLIVTVITVLFAAGCSKKSQAAQTAGSGASAADSQAAGIAAPKKIDLVKHQVMVFDLEGLADDGSKKWNIKGQSAESVTEDQVKLNNITASTYGKENRATITADTGLYDRSKSNVHLEQNVKAVIENTPKGAADFVTLPDSAANAASPERPGFQDADKTKKTKTTITCDAEVEFDYEKNEGYFNKNVHVVNDDGSIDADKLTVYLDSATKAVKTIVAEGNVKIRRGENISYSDKATYIAADKKIILTGQPRLVIYQESNSQGDILNPVKK